MTVPIVALRSTGYLPLSNITPFTYRDGATFLECLEDVRQKTNEVVESFNGLIGMVNDVLADQALIRQEMAEMETRVELANAKLSESVDLRLKSLRIELLDAIGKAMTGVADDPTSGKTAVPVSIVLSNVYDYARLNGGFAKRLDEQELTALDMDGAEHTARHLDLSRDDTIDDDLTIPPRKITTV